MWDDWITAPADRLLFTALTALGIYVAAIVYTRLSGLRSFSKMSSFDFAMTVAVGSTVASTLVAKNPPLLQGVVGLGSLFLLQKIVALVRRLDWATKLLDNTPLLLIRDGEILYDNMRKSQVTIEDIRSKLREANIVRLQDVQAMVFETTGNISVMSSDEHEVEEWLLDGVTGHKPLDEHDHERVGEVTDHPPPHVTPSGA